MAEEAIAHFRTLYEARRLELMRKKLGLLSQEEADDDLIGQLLDIMHTQEMDYTATFRQLATQPLCSDAYPAPFQHWLATWEARLARQTATRKEAQTLICLNNPARIPRNHQVEAALDAAVNQYTLEPLQHLLSALQQPYTDTTGFSAYDAPPALYNSSYRTFCGT